MPKNMGKNPREKQNRGTKHAKMGAPLGKIAAGA